MDPGVVINIAFNDRDADARYLAALGVISKVDQRDRAQRTVRHLDKRISHEAKLLKYFADGLGGSGYFRSDLTPCDASNQTARGAAQEGSKPRTNNIPGFSAPACGPALFIAG